MKRARRTDWYYVVTCNGDDTDGCRWVLICGRDEALARERAARHARDRQHETIVTIENAVTVYDGRVSR